MVVQLQRSQISLRSASVTLSTHRLPLAETDQRAVRHPQHSTQTKRAPTALSLPFAVDTVCTRTRVYPCSIMRVRTYACIQLLS
jgi:hypothetical protein